jgi:hypothetical protein
MEVAVSPKNSANNLSEYMKLHPAKTVERRHGLYLALKRFCACLLATYDSSSSQFFAQKELSYHLSESTGCSIYDAANELGKPLLRGDYRETRWVYVSAVASYIEGSTLDSAKTTAFRNENRKMCFPECHAGVLITHAS